MESVISDWNTVKSTITNERFTLGPLLGHSFPSSIKDNTLIVDVNHKEDVNILNNSIDYLTKRFQEILRINLKLRFKFNSAMNSKQNEGKQLEDQESDESYKDHPLIQSIIKDLGGREIK